MPYKQMRGSTLRHRLYARTYIRSNYKTEMTAMYKQLLNSCGTVHKRSDQRLFCESDSFCITRSIAVSKLRHRD